MLEKFMIILFYLGQNFPPVEIFLKGIIQMFRL